MPKKNGRVITLRMDETAFEIVESMLMRKVIVILNKLQCRHDLLPNDLGMISLMIEECEIFLSNDEP